MKIQAMFCNSDKVRNLAYKAYFNLALEKNADKWAMQYIKSHQSQVHQWEQALTKNYKKIYPLLLDKLDLEMVED